MKNVLINFGIFILMSIFPISSIADEKLTPDIAWQKINSGALVIDVRTEGEFSSGHLDNALHIPYDQIEGRATELQSHKEKEIVLYCKSGRRSGIAAQTLAKLGFKNVHNIGGYEELIKNKP